MIAETSMKSMDMKWMIIGIIDMIRKIAEDGTRNQRPDITRATKIETGDPIEGNIEAIGMIRGIEIVVAGEGNMITSEKIAMAEIGANVTIEIATQSIVTTKNRTEIIYRQ